MPLAATSVARRVTTSLIAAGTAVALLLVGQPTDVSACSYVDGVQPVGFRGAMTALTQDGPDIYDVDFVVSKVFLGVVPHHVKVREVPAIHLEYVRRNPVDIHALEYQGEFDWQRPCDSPDVSTTPFLSLGYAPAPDPPTAPEAHGLFVPIAVLGGLALLLSAGYGAVRRSDRRQAT